MIQRWSSFTLLMGAMLALLAYGASEGDLALGAGSALAGFLGWLVGERWDVALPRWLISLAMIGVLAWTLTRFTHAEALASAFTGLLATLVVLKLWERRRPREDGQLLTLSIFLTIGATLNDNGLIVGGILLIQTPLALAGVMVHHLRLPMLPQVPTPRRSGIGRAFSLLMLVMCVAGFLIAASVFVFVPRGIGGDQLGRFGHVGLSRVSGLADSIELGRAGLISQSQATVLELTLRDGEGAPLGGEGESYYLRARSLDRYSEGRWTHHPAGYHETDLEPGQRENFLWPPRHARMIEQRMRVRSVAADADLPAILTPVWVSWDQPGRLRLDRETHALSRRGSAGPLVYSVASWIGPVPSEDARRGRDISFASPRIRRLAGEVLARSQLEPDPGKRAIADDPAAARALESHLRTRRSYTLDIQAPPDGIDPTEWFIFEAQAGHCEYFASALAAMCQCVGIEARVATGYVASEWDASRSTYVVRRAHAHAWVEVHAGNGRWLTYDATPPADLVATHDAGRGLLTRLARWFDGLESVWASSVVSFDQFSQGRLLGQRPGHAGAVERGLLWVRRSLQGSRPGGQDLLDASGGPGLVSLAAFIVGGALVIGGIVLIVRRRSGGKRARATNALLAEWQRLCARHGVIRPAWQPPLAFANEIAMTHPHLAQIGRAVAMATYESMFGGRELSPSRVKELRGRMRAGFSDV